MSLVRWLLLVVCAALVLHGLVAWRLFEQEVWEPAGLSRLVWFSALILAPTLMVGLWRPRWLWPATLLTAGDAAFAFTAALAALAFLVSLLAHFPVNVPALYFALWLAPLAAAWRFGSRRPAPPESKVEGLAAGVLITVLALHAVTVFKPEVGGDGLAMHLVILARLKAHGLWSFDVSRFTWAVMPMGGDWALALGYMAGGELGARLLNFGFLVLTVMLLNAELRRRLPGWTAYLCLAAYVSAPLLQLTTGCLFAENWNALLIVAAFVAVRRFWDSRGWPHAVLAGLLCGMALQTKFGGIALAVILLAALGLNRFAAAAAGLALVVGCVPYVEAWLRTGNPVFPFLNHLFRSPLYDAAQPLRDVRFAQPLGWRTLYDLTFQSPLFLECQRGAFGFLALLTLPFAVASLGRTSPRAAWLALLLSVAGGAVLLASAPNLRYLAPPLAIFILLLGYALAGARADQPRLFTTAVALVALLVPLQVYFLASSNWYHKDLFPLNAAERAAYLARSAPGRVLAEGLGNATVVWLEEAPIGEFTGRAYTNTWHSNRVYWRLQEVGSAADLAACLLSLGAQYVIAPDPASLARFTTVHAPTYLAQHTVVVKRLSGWVLAKPAPGRERPIEYAGPGAYDELGACTQFEGPWTRGIQFAGAYRDTLAYSDRAGAAVSVRFTGDAVTLLYSRAFNRGKAAVLIDGRPYAELSQWSRTIGWQTRAHYRGLGPGAHTLTLRVLGGGFIDLDGFTVP